jgi:AcrR family transcriptional regulator
MARKPPSPSAPDSGEPAAAAAPPTPPASDRERIVAAFMTILATRAFEDIGFAEIAARAEVSLAGLRREFGSRVAILAAFIKDVDQKVLDGIDADMASEPARERLFDVLMRRIEILGPHKDAIRSLMNSVRTDPCLAVALNGMAVQTHQWMLTAADIDASGVRGMMRAQGTALLFARVLQTFVRDDDPGHARTMAALDKQLSRGERMVGVLDQLCRFAPARFLARGLRGRRDRYDRDTREPGIGDDAVPV